MGADEPAPGIQVKEKWGGYIVITSGARWHGPNSLPVLYLLCRRRPTVSMKL